MSLLVLNRAVPKSANRGLRRLLLVVLLVAGWNCADTQPALAATSITVTTNYYNVVGTTVEELSSSLSTNRPWKTNTYRAKTDWSIGYNFHFGVSNGLFYLSRFDLRTRIQMTLPRWQTRAEADPALRLAWDKFFRGLLTHENGHLQFGLSATKDISSRLGALPGAASREELKSSVERSVDEVLDRKRKKEEEYDRVTRSGFTQGAVFPPLPVAPQR